MKKKISDEQLKKELVDNGKSQKQIADEYGYGYPSRTLSARIRKLDANLKERSKFSKHPNGGRTLHLNEEEIRQSLPDTDGEWFYEADFKDGKILLTFHREKWSVEDD